MGPALWLANSRQTWFLTRHPVPACAMRSVEEHLRGYDFAVSEKDQSKSRRQYAV